MNRRTSGAASSTVQWLNRRSMGVRTEDSVSLCQKALQIVTELCLAGHVDREKCSDIFPLESSSPGKGHADISISLLAVVAKVKLQEVAMKISQTSPDIPAEVQTALRDKLSQQAKIQRQTTEPTSSSRHTSFRRHLPRQMNVTSVDFSVEALPVRQSSAVSIGRIKPELYKQKSVDSRDGEAREPAEACGKLSFSLRYDHEARCLVVRVLRALDLPAKDFTGTSDPYVKIYLLPDRQKKFQTRVHPKNLNPAFDETFRFAAAYDELCARKLHFSVYDFDRFSSHDMIGEAVADNLFELSDLSREAVVWKDIHAATTKRKTTTKKTTLNPVYNEAIVFDIPPENVEQVSLSITVMDYDR
ncbi:hypothetical protein NHX12_020631 [Muraenolepis orangiensis]|uniref:C2 domain-containing protein n=1 Tax=Muraenolepis orangiensis TaxID=630683 RepID=A0A9Q0IW06_9TELE|nr:hypothetical protein NHX12_020631 [Muraenolepis orangiensis]